jgi:SlyX protein
MDSIVDVSGMGVSDTLSRAGAGAGSLPGGRCAGAKALNPTREEEAMAIGEERLVAIETKIAFQEKTIRDLNDVLLEQQQEIRKIEALCAGLAERVRELSETAGPAAPTEGRPRPF